jgi:glycopeptide antibiotics resistance protein
VNRHLWLFLEQIPKEISRFALIGLLVAYTGAILFGTLSPFDFRADARAVAMGHLAPEWIPFTSWNARCGWPGYFEDKLLNICIFIPFGVLLGLIVQHRPRPGMPLLKTTMAAALCSLIIEAAQFFLPGRHPTVSDLLMNAAGGFLGAWLVTRGIQSLSLNFQKAS